MFYLLTCSVVKHWNKLPVEAMELGGIQDLTGEASVLSLFEHWCEQGFMLDKDSYSKVLSNLNCSVT